MKKVQLRNMGSDRQPLVVPVVDLSNENMEPGTDAWLSACKQVQHALEEFGCFEAPYKKDTLETQNSIYSALKDLCDLPLETKMHKTSDKPLHGYFARNPLFPHDFSTGIENPETAEGAQNFTSIMWPAGNERSRESVHSFSKMMVELDQMVSRMVFDISGMGRLYDSQQASTTYHALDMKYRSRRMRMMRDCFLTQTSVSQAYNIKVRSMVCRSKQRQANGFDYAPSSPSSFMVLASDILMPWSNDRICACEHQVILKEKKTRYAVSLFSYKNDVVQVPEELVDNKHPLRYKPFDHLDFLRFFLTEEGQKAKHDIKAYCGV